MDAQLQKDATNLCQRFLKKELEVLLLVAKKSDSGNQITPIIGTPKGISFFQKELFNLNILKKFVSHCYDGDVVECSGQKKSNELDKKTRSVLPQKIKIKKEIPETLSSETPESAPFRRTSRTIKPPKWKADYAIDVKKEESKTKESSQRKKDGKSPSPQKANKEKTRSSPRKRQREDSDDEEEEEESIDVADDSDEDYIPEDDEGNDLGDKSYELGDENTSKEGTYNCEICHKRFTTSRQYKSHKNIHEKNGEKKVLVQKIERNSSLPRVHLKDDGEKQGSGEKTKKNDAKKMEEKSLEVKCRLCNEVFGSEKEELFHVITAHTSKFCIFCNKIFKEEAKLTEHSSKQCKLPHERSLKKCYFCKMILRSKFGFETHVKNFHMAQNFPCCICQKRFKDRFALSRHEKDHSFTGDLKCLWCNIEFTEEKDFITHQQEVHNSDKKTKLETENTPVGVSEKKTKLETKNKPVGVSEKKTKLETENKPVGTPNILSNDISENDSQNILSESSAENMEENITKTTESQQNQESGNQKTNDSRKEIAKMSENHQCRGKNSQETKTSENQPNEEDSCQDNDGASQDGEGKRTDARAQDKDGASQDGEGKPTDVRAQDNDGASQDGEGKPTDVRAQDNDGASQDGEGKPTDAAAQMLSLGKDENLLKRVSCDKKFEENKLKVPEKSHMDVNKCKICDFVFEKNIDEFKHMLHRHKDNYCSWCNLACNDADEMSLHNDYCQPGEKTRKKCFLCKKMLHTKFGFEYHMLVGHSSFSSTENQCYICEEVFTSKDLLIGHIMKHSTVTEKKSKGNVKLSDKVIPSKNDLEEAFVDIHEGSGISFRCNSCNVDFKTIELFKEHKKSHGRHIKCQLCDETFAKKVEEYKHMLLVHEDLFCSWCNVTFLTKEEAVNHARDSECQIGVAAGKKCHFCSKKLHSKATLEKHVLVVHNEKDKCYICDEIFPSKSLLNRHIRTHSTVAEEKCEICGKIFKMKEYLKRHMKEVHHIISQWSAAKKAKLEMIEGSECCICKEVYPSKTELAGHIKEVHIEQIKQEVEGNEKFTIAFGKDFTCRRCGKSFSNEVDEIIHMAKHLSYKSSEKRFICEICGKVYMTRYTYRDHLLAHNSVKKFKCDVCQKSFRLKSTLTMHKQTHNEKRQFICHICGHPFKSQASLLMHTKRHNLNRYHECSYCKEKFRAYDGLKYHWVQFHPEEIKKRNIRTHTCPYCNKVFAAMSQYRRHISIHDGIKDYSCDHCSAKYATLGQLNSHRKNSHFREKIYNCHACDVSFTIPSKLARHLKTSKHIENCRSKGIDQKVFVDMVTQIEKEAIRTSDLSLLRKTNRKILMQTISENSESQVEVGTEVSPNELVDILQEVHNHESMEIGVGSDEFVANLPDEVVHQIEISNSGMKTNTTEILLVYNAESNSITATGNQQSLTLDAQAAETLQRILQNQCQT